MVAVFTPQLLLNVWQRLGAGRLGRGTWLNSFGCFWSQNTKGDITKLTPHPSAHSIIHSFSKYNLSPYYMPGAIWTMLFLEQMRVLFGELPTGSNWMVDPNIAFGFCCQERLAQVQEFFLLMRNGTDPWTLLLEPLQEACYVPGAVCQRERGLCCIWIIDNL